jgi:predicted dinucleotide-utilizing enzyme
VDVSCASRFSVARLTDDSLDAGLRLFVVFFAAVFERTLLKSLQALLTFPAWKMKESINAAARGTSASLNKKITTHQFL